MGGHNSNLDLVITAVFGLAGLITALRIGFASTTLLRMFLKYLASWVVLCIIFGVNRGLYFALGAPIVFLFCWYVIHRKFNPGPKSVAGSYATAAVTSGFIARQAQPRHPHIVTFP